MADLLLRHLDEDTKRLIRLKAAENRRSQSAEACATLKEAYSPQGSFEDSWIFRLRQVALDEHFEIEQPQRHQPRKADLWWLQESPIANESMHPKQ